MSNNLTAEDKRVIDEFNRHYGPVLQTIERARQFKLNDYLLLYVSNSEGKMLPQLNSYGAPVKYKVVHVTEDGMPFVKRTNKNGNPVGGLYSVVGTGSDDYRPIDRNFEFILDPDYADALLLQDDQFDPAQLHRSKKDIWNAVTKHNKSVKVKTDQLQDVIDFFGTLVIGDTLWTSNIGYYLIQDIKQMSPKDFNNKANWREQTRVKGPFVLVLTVLDKNGKVKDITADFFWGKALYRERPRTYKELNI
jgi:hypothetical protein